MDTKEARFKIKVRLSNSIHTKLQQMQTNVWGQKADEWLAAAEEGRGDEYQGPHVHYLVSVMALWLYIVPQLLQIVHLHMDSFPSTSINLNTTLFFFKYMMQGWRNSSMGKHACCISKKA